MKLRNFLKPIRLYQKIILVFILLMLLVYFIGAYVNISVQNQIRGELQNSIEMRMQYLAGEIDKDVSHLQAQQRQLKVDVNMQKLLLVPNLDDMEMITGLVNNVYGRIFTIQNSSIYVSEVVVCMAQLQRSISSTSFYRPWNATDQNVMKLDGNSNVLNIRDDGVYLIENLSQRYLQSSPQGSVCYIKLSLAALSQSLKEVSSTDGLSVFLMDGSDVVLSAGTGIEGFADSYNAGTRKSDSSSRTFAATINGRSFLVIRQRMDSIGMDLVACMPEQAFTRIMLKNQLWIVILTAVAIVSFVAFSLIASKMINRPLRRFVQAFQEVEHDNLDISILHPSTDEFAYLYGAFNNMTKRLKNSIQQVYQHEIATQRAELKQLQSQINPHFLYNSFFHIYRMCKMDDIDGVAEFSLKLSNFYQYITRSGTDTVPLEMEYRHAQDYSDIQRVRFGSRIQVIFSPLPEEFRNVAVPKLMLQPVLENAYLHGSEAREEDTSIYVKVIGEGGGLKITVEDNGNGMDEESLQKLSGQLADPLPAQETTGLINVSQRLHIKYGGRSGVTVGRSEYGGLKVELFLGL